MDETGPPKDEEDDTPPPPSAFGVPAHPLGCGLLGGALFALAFAPVALINAAPDPCSNLDRAGDCPWPPDGTWLGLASAAWAAAAFGLATATIVARRLALWREGRDSRPRLWVAFVALFAIAWGPGSVLLALLLAAIDAVRG